MPRIIGGIKCCSGRDEVTTTTTQGNQKAFGVATESIADTAYGLIQTSGKTTLLKVNGTTAIVVGDFIGSFTTAEIGMKAARKHGYCDRSRSVCGGR